MFVKEGPPLGKGAYGTVYKVRSLLSTKLGSTGIERYLVRENNFKQRIQALPSKNLANVTKNVFLNAS